jgi:hypothetical protein
MSGEETLPAKLKHLSAQVAIDVQPPMALSQGSAGCGQQSSIGPAADMSMASCVAMGSCDVDIGGDLGVDLGAILPAAGNKVTDREMSAAKMVRPIPMDQPCCAGITGAQPYGQATIS